MPVRIYVLIFQLLISAMFLCISEPSFALKVRVGMDSATSPFAIESSDTGLEVEIIRAAFSSQAIETEFIFLVNTRVAIEFKRNKIDINTAAQPDGTKDQILSHFPVLSFDNQAIFMKKKNLSIISISDLGKYRVVAWQDAQKHLGKEYSEMAQKNKNYRELSYMPSHMLISDRADVFISQPDIFRASLLDSVAQNNKAKMLDQLEYAPVFPNYNKYYYAFRDEKLRAAYEAGIKSIYKSGKIDQIFNDYLMKYGTSRSMFRELDCRFSEKYKPRGCG